MCASIWLKFGTHIEGLNENTSIKFAVNLISIQEVISDFTHKAKPNLFHAYWVSRFEEHAEHQYVSRLNIRGMPFGG